MFQVLSAVRSAQQANRQKALKKLMIKSVMPPSIATKVQEAGNEAAEKTEINKKDLRRFRNFIMQQLVDLLKILIWSGNNCNIWKCFNQTKIVINDRNSFSLY